MINYVEIKKLFNIEKGSLQSSKCIEGEYDFITASSEWKKHKEYTHDNEALIVAVAASGSLGRVHYVNGKFITSDLCFILTPKSKDFPVDLSFYYYIFKSIRDDLVKSTATGTSKLAINKTNFGNYKLPYVDITKQRNFKSKLINVAVRKEKLSESNEIQLNFIQTLRQQILQDAITGKLSEKWRKENPNVDSAEILLEKIKAEKEKLIKEGKIKKQKAFPKILKDEIPFDLPERWIWSMFIDIASIESNLVQPENYRKLRQIAPDCIEKNTGRIITARSVEESEIISANHYFKSGQLIYSKVRPKLNKVIFVDFDGLCSADMYPIRPFINGSYLKFAMLSDFFLTVVDKYDNRVKMPKLNQNQLSRIPIPIPPLGEQEFIADKVTRIFDTLERIKIQNHESSELFSLLNQVVLKEMFEK